SALLEREPFRRAIPIVRAVVAEPAIAFHLLEHRLVVARAFRTDETLVPIGYSHSTEAFGEGGRATNAREPLSDLLAQAADVAQAETDPAVGFDRAIPAGDLHVDRMEAHAAALRVLHERRRMVEPHRLIVQE